MLIFFHPDPYCSAGIYRVLSFFHLSELICVISYRLGKRQINAFAKILHFSEDTFAVEEKQQQLKKECLEAWNVEIIKAAPSAPLSDDPEVLARRLLENDLSKCFKKF